MSFGESTWWDSNMQQTVAWIFKGELTEGVTIHYNLDTGINWVADWSIHVYMAHKLTSACFEQEISIGMPTHYYVFQGDATWLSFLCSQIAFVWFSFTYFRQQFHFWRDRCESLRTIIANQPIVSLVGLNGLCMRDYLPAYAWSPIYRYRLRIWIQDLRLGQEWRN